MFKCCLIYGILIEVMIFCTAIVIINAYIWIFRNVTIDEVVKMKNRNNYKRFISKIKKNH